MYSKKAALLRSIRVTCNLKDLIYSYRNGGLPQTSSSIVKIDRSVFLILKPISYLFGVYMALVFYLETIGVRKIMI